MHHAFFDFYQKLNKLIRLMEIEALLGVSTWKQSGSKKTR